MSHASISTSSPQAALHDAYAADYDREVRAYDCYLAEALFGLCYESVRPGESMLDLGIGSGLSAALFARAGLLVSGMDFSAAMLELCHHKGIAQDLRQHDLLDMPWPYPSRSFDHVICCGVFHFIPDLDTIFSQTKRVLRAGGLFAFTTKSPLSSDDPRQQYERLSTSGLEVYSHSPIYIDMLRQQNCLRKEKMMRCFVGQEIHEIWVGRKGDCPGD